jgi:tetratricopeptide (TPR) repeat protein
MRHLPLIFAVCSFTACNEQPPSPGAAPSASSARAPAAAAASDAGSGALPITSTSPEAIAAFERGREFADNTHEVEAIEQFQKAIQLDPKFALAHAYLGYYTAEAEGMASLDQAVSLAQSLPEAERLVIEELREVRRGDIVKARELAERVVKLVPFDWHAQFDLGDRLFAENRLDEAAERLRKAAAFGPPSYAVYNQLGYVQLAQRDFDGAVSTFRRYTELKPDEPNAVDSFAEALLNAGKLDEAEKSFRRAAEMKFSYSWGGVAQARFLQGNEAGTLEALAKSREAAARPIDKLEVDAIAVWATMSRPAEAKKRIEALEKEAHDQKLDEQYANASVYRAVALLEENAGEAAVHELDQALRRGDKPSLPGGASRRLKRTAYAWRAVAESRLGKAADAQKTAEALDKLAAGAPNEPAVQSAAHLGRGLAALAKGDGQLAVKELSSCLEDDLLCQWQLSVAQDKAGDKAGADATRSKVAKVKLRDPLYLYIHGKVTSPAGGAKAP